MLSKISDSEEKIHNKQYLGAQRNREREIPLSIVALQPGGTNHKNDQDEKG
jgi:hypothetical protein